LALFSLLDFYVDLADLKMILADFWTLLVEVAGVTFSDSGSAPISNIWTRIRIRQFFKFENPAPVENLATTDPTMGAILL